MSLSRIAPERLLDGRQRSRTAVAALAALLCFFGALPPRGPRFVAMAFATEPPSNPSTPTVASPAPTTRAPTLGPSRASSGYHLGIEALTDFPIQVGGRLWLEFPHRVRFDVSGGWLPGPYMDVINGILVSGGAYNRETADVIREALKNSALLRVHLGWRPFPRYGFYFGLGYGLAALGGGLSDEQALVFITGHSAPNTEEGKKYTYSVNSVLHFVSLDIGYQLLLWKDRFTLRFAVGLLATIWSKTDIKPDFKPDPRVEQQTLQITQLAAQLLDETYRSYVFAPSVTVAVGYRFF